jgi:type 1 fimbriae regulatory protein FimB
VFLLRRDDVNLDEAPPWVRRLKNSRSVEHPIAGDELRAVRRYLATREDRLPWMFISERGQPLTRRAVFYLISTCARDTCEPRQVRLVRQRIDALLLVLQFP